MLHSAPRAELNGLHSHFLTLSSFNSMLSIIFHFSFALACFFQPLPFQAFLPSSNWSFGFHWLSVSPFFPSFFLLFVFAFALLQHFIFLLLFSFLASEFRASLIPHFCHFVHLTSVSGRFLHHTRVAFYFLHSVFGWLVGWSIGHSLAF